ncbi:MAG: recombinase family protein [Oscillospiraceae bacterium]
MAGQENQQYTVLYGRLSQEDERAGESNSIQHQRTLLEKYAKEKGFENTIFLADDGYSGTNFERPSWKKIVEMIEAGQVANLIVKDASRLGREYLQVGYYMEIYFPRRMSASSRSTMAWIPQWRAAMTSTPSATGPTSFTPRIPAARSARS